MQNMPTLIHSYSSLLHNHAPLPSPNLLQMPILKTQRLALIVDIGCTQ